MRRRGVEAFLALVALLVAAPGAFADAGRVMGEVVSTVLPVTPAQSREIAALLRSPGTVAVDVVDTTDALVDAVKTLPAGLLHDVITAPVRDWHVARGLVSIDKARELYGVALTADLKVDAAGTAKLRMAVAAE